MKANQSHSATEFVWVWICCMLTCHVQNRALWTHSIHSCRSCIKILSEKGGRLHFLKALHAVFY